MGHLRGIRDSITKVVRNIRMEYKVEYAEVKKSMVRW